MVLMASADPDRLALSKSEILLFCDRVLKKWSEDPAKNTNNIATMNAMRTSVVWTDEKTLVAIWREITSWMYELMYENALAQATQDGASWPDTLRGAQSG